METVASPPAPAPLPRTSSIITSPTMARHGSIITSTSPSQSNEMVIIQLSMELSPLSPPINTSPAIPSHSLFPPPTTLAHSQSVPTTPTNKGISEHKESTPPHPLKRQISDILSTPQRTSMLSHTPGSLSRGRSISIPSTPFGIVIVPTHITYATLRTSIATEFTSDVMASMDTMDETMKRVIAQGTYGFVRRGVTLLQSHESFHLVDETSITLRPIASTPTTASLLSPLTIGSHGQHDALSSSGLLLDSTAHHSRHLTTTHPHGTTAPPSDVMLQHDPSIQEAITNMSHGGTPAVTSPSHPSTTEHTPAGSPSHHSMIMNLIRHHSMMPFTTHKHRLPSALHTMMTGEKTNIPAQPMQEPDIGHIPQLHTESSQQRTLSQQQPPSDTIPSPHIFSFLQQQQQQEQQQSQQALHQPYHRPMATTARPFVGLPSKVELMPDDEDDDFSDTSTPSSASTSYIESSEDEGDEPIKHIPINHRHALRITIIGEKESTHDEDAAQPGAARGVIREMDSLEEFLSLPYDGTYADSATPLWIAVENANDAVYESIGHKFGLHPLTVEDCQTKTTREKLEIFQTYLFLVFHAFYNKRNDGYGMYDKPVTTPIRLIVYPHLILSFHRSSVANVEMVRARLDKSYGNCLENTAWVIHALLDSIVDSLQPVVEGINMQVDALDDLIYILSGNEHRDLLKRMSLIRRRLSFLRQRLWSKKDILTSLIGKDWQSFLNGVQIPYLRDVYDHVVTMLNTVESSSSVLLSLQSTYFANVSIDVSAAATNVNAVMKRMSAMAAIILPLTLVSGIMGMNVNIPFQHDSENKEHELGAFWFILGIMIVSVLAVMILFKRKRMI